MKYKVSLVANLYTHTCCKIPRTGAAITFAHWFTAQLRGEGGGHYSSVKYRTANSNKKQRNSLNIQWNEQSRGLLVFKSIVSLLLRSATMCLNTVSLEIIDCSIYDFGSCFPKACIHGTHHQPKQSSFKKPVHNCFYIGLDVKTHSGRFHSYLCSSEAVPLLLYQDTNKKQLTWKQIMGKKENNCHIYSLSCNVDPEVEQLS